MEWPLTGRNWSSGTKNKIVPSVALSTINNRWTALGSNPSLRGDRQSTKCVALRGAFLAHLRAQKALHQVLKLTKGWNLQTEDFEPELPDSPARWNHTPLSSLLSIYSLIALAPCTHPVQIPQDFCLKTSSRLKLSYWPYSPKTGELWRSVTT